MGTPESSLASGASPSDRLGSKQADPSRDPRAARWWKPVGVALGVSLGIGIVLAPILWLTTSPQVRRAGAPHAGAEAISVDALMTPCDGCPAPSDDRPATFEWAGRVLPGTVGDPDAPNGVALLEWRAKGANSDPPVPPGLRRLPREGEVFANPAARRWLEANPATAEALSPDGGAPLPMDGPTLGEDPAILISRSASASFNSNSYQASAFTSGGILGQSTAPNDLVLFAGGAARALLFFPVIGVFVSGLVILILLGARAIQSVRRPTTPTTDTPHEPGAPRLGTALTACAAGLVATPLAAAAVQPVASALADLVSPTAVVRAPISSSALALVAIFGALAVLLVTWCGGSPRVVRMARSKVPVALAAVFGVICMVGATQVDPPGWAPRGPKAPASVAVGDFARQADGSSISDAQARLRSVNSSARLDTAVTVAATVDAASVTAVILRASRPDGEPAVDFGDAIEFEAPVEMAAAPPGLLVGDEGVIAAPDRFPFEPGWPGVQIGPVAAMVTADNTDDPRRPKDVSFDSLEGPVQLRVGSVDLPVDLVTPSDLAARAADSETGNVALGGVDIPPPDDTGSWLGQTPVLLVTPERFASLGSADVQRAVVGLPSGDTTSALDALLFALPTSNDWDIKPPPGGYPTGWSPANSGLRLGMFGLMLVLAALVLFASRLFASRGAVPSPAGATTIPSPDEAGS